MTDRGWLVIACKGGWESKTVKELERQEYAPGLGYACYLPYARIPRVKRGAKYDSLEPLFPGYLFLEKPAGISVDDLQCGAINSTRGVLGYLSITNAGRPNVVPHEAIEWLQSTIAEDGDALCVGPDGRRIEPDHQFVKGERVTITGGGSFQGWPATFVRYDEKRRDKVVVVEVSLLNRVIDVFVKPSALKVAS